jgi:hypothetical protein
LSTGLPADLLPTSADRSADGTLLGYNFLGDQALSTGETSDLLIVRTNAIGYFTYFRIGGTVTDAAGDQAVGVPFFGPIPVPEPSTGSMSVGGGLSLIAVGLLRRAVRRGPYGRLRRVLQTGWHVGRTPNSQDLAGAPVLPADNLDVKRE